MQPAQFFQNHSWSHQQMGYRGNLIPSYVIYFYGGDEPAGQELQNPKIQINDPGQQIQRSHCPSLGPEKNKRDQQLQLEKPDGVKIETKAFLESKSHENRDKSTHGILRNILPNIIHHIFCYVHKQTRSGRVVQKMFENQNLIICPEMTIKRFYNYQKLIKDKITTYINIKALRQLNQLREPKCEIYSLKQQIEYLRLTRILIKHFLENDLQSVILTSARMKSESRIWYFELKRKAIASIKQILSDL